MSNFDGGTCEDVSCNDIYEEKACKDAGCTFDEDMYICYNDTGKACSTYSSFSSCPPNRCIFNYDEVRKHVCGCSPSFLLPPPPPLLFLSFCFLLQSGSGDACVSLRWQKPCRIGLGR